MFQNQKMAITLKESQLDWSGFEKACEANVEKVYEVDEFDLKTQKIMKKMESKKSVLDGLDQTEFSTLVQMLNEILLKTKDFNVKSLSIAPIILGYSKNNIQYMFVNHRLLDSPECSSIHKTLRGGWMECLL